MFSFPLKKLMKRRIGEFRGYSIRTDPTVLTAEDAPQLDQVCFVFETVNHDLMRVSYIVMSELQAKKFIQGNPHSNITGWFFRFDGKGWMYLGGGKWLDDLNPNYVNP